MQHATKEVRKGAGENLFWTSTSTDPLQPVQSWYDEIKDYDFDNPGYKQKGGKVGRTINLVFFSKCICFFEKGNNRHL